MPRVFVSYRREDSAASAGRLGDRLTHEFGKKHVFMDVDSIPFGSDFVKRLAEEVQRCDVLLAVIGPEWTEIRDEDGIRRLDDPNDFVRVEIREALQRDIPVVPVLLEGTKIPKASSLPEDIKLLALRNALHLRHGSFQIDLDRLVQQLKVRPREVPYAFKSMFGTSTRLALRLLLGSCLIALVVVLLQQWTKRSDVDIEDWSAPPGAMVERPIGDVEKIITFDEGKAFQRAICVTDDSGDFGFSGSDTRVALRNFYRAQQFPRDSSPPETVATTANLRSLRIAQATIPSCQAAGLANAFEVGVLTRPVDVAGTIDPMKNVSDIVVALEKASIPVPAALRSRTFGPPVSAALREVIPKLRNAYNLSGPAELDRALYKSIIRAAAAN